MTDHELEQRIRTAVEHAAPDRLNIILSSCGQQNNVAGAPVHPGRPDGQTEGVIMNMSEVKNQNTKSKAGKRLAAIAVAAAMLVLCIGGYALFQSAATPEVDSVVMLDVNPSLSLSVDSDENVLAAEALNADAVEVLGSMELKGASLEVAVNAIIGSMLQKGYLGDLQNAILVSVENADAARGEALQQKVAAAIASAAKSGALDAAVLSQVVSADDTSLAALAAQHSVSLGKAALIQEVVTQDPTLTFDDLAPMTINEIALIAASRDVSGTSVTLSGTASNKAYLGQEEVLNLVYGHAGVAAEDVVKFEVELDSKNGTMIYEMEFETSSQNGEYEINAATGEILKSELKNQTVSNDNSDNIGAAAAKNAALSHAGVAVGDVLEIRVELDSDNRKTVYQVEFETVTAEYEYKIDALTGAVMSFEAEDRDNSSASGGGSAAASGNFIGESAAKNAALSHADVAAGDVLEIRVELDSDNRKTVYQVEFETVTVEYEYKIDALTGAVMSFEAENRDGSSASGGGSAAASGNFIGESAAKNAALSHADVAESSTAYIKCYLEYDDGKPSLYCVEFKAGKTEYEYKIDPYSGAVVDFDAENHDDANGFDSGNVSSENTSYIGESAALAAALKHAGVSESALKEKHTELDRDGGTVIYEVEFETSQNKYEYAIDASSGAVLKAEKH